MELLNQSIQQGKTILLVIILGVFFIVASSPTNIPKITILGDNPVTIEKGAVYNDAGATADDIEDGEVDVITTGISTVDTSIVGTYIVTYTATDQDTNQTIATRKVIVKESISSNKDTIILSIETGSQIYIDDISTIVTYPITIKDDTATWDQPFWDFFEDKGRYGSSQIVKGNLTLSFTVNKNGTIVVQTKSSDKNDHLFVFLNGGWKEYNLTSSSWLYEASRKLYVKFRDNNLLSGNILSDDKEFSTATMSQNNYFQEDITIIMSRLAHHQMDYSWITKETIEWQKKQNTKWSPIASKPDQNANISRSFSIQNNTATSAVFLLMAWADNHMTSETKVEGLKNIEDYSYGYHGDILQCDSTEGWCKAWNESCCAIRMINKGSIPTKVTMKARTTWSTVRPAFVIAAFGDITTNNHTESPTPGDDNNPAPLRFVLPSQDKTDSFLFKKTSQKISYGADYNQACINEFGSDWTLADWNNLKNYFLSGKDMKTLVSRLGLDAENDSAWVTKDDDNSYSGSRDYYMSYHNHQKPSHYLAHENIDNYFLSLGSWYSPQYSLCIKKSNNLSNGLVAYYPFNGNANDESGSGNDGVVNGATLAIDRNGNAKSAYSFDGVNDNITTGSTFGDNATQISVNLWFKSNSLKTRWSGILGRDRGAANIDDVWNIILSKNEIKTEIVEKGNREFSLSHPIDTSWHNLSMVYNGVTHVLKLYYDGSLKNQLTTDVGILNSTPELTLSIGSYSNNTFMFNGLIDDIRIYDRALSESEIQELYAR